MTETPEQYLDRRLKYYFGDDYFDMNDQNCQICGSYVTHGNHLIHVGWHEELSNDLSDIRWLAKEASYG